MAVIKCKMCGGDMELSADKTFGTCEYCGSTMTLPRVDDEVRAAAFNRGNHFRRIGEFDKALAVYERIVREDENDAEAHWCCALCRFGIEYVEDPGTYEYLPTCHRASFDSFLEDVDYLAALEHSDGITRRQYQKEAAKIAEVQRGILATSQNEEPFDVFLCYKESDADGNRTKDSVMAQEIYYQLTSQGYRVFFSRITLEDKAGTQYEPYIFAALNSAKVMVALGTSEQNFNAVWVKNEWSRFLALMKKDRTKLLLPCYRDMDPYDLPEQLSILQSYDMGKIGFMQDLTRGISKVLDAEKQSEPARETVVVQNEGGANRNALLKRGNMALEDLEWEKADEFFDRVLDMDAECAEAHFGKYLAEMEWRNMAEFREKNCACRVMQYETMDILAEERRKSRDEYCAKYQIPGYLTENEISKIIERAAVSCQQRLKFVQKHISENRQDRAENRLLTRAQSFARGDFAKTLQDTLNEINNWEEQKLTQTEAADRKAVEEATETARAKLKEAQEQVVHRYEEACQNVEADRKAEEARQAEKRRLAAEWKEEQYQAFCKAMTEASNSLAYHQLKTKFDFLADYKDCQQRINQCTEKEAELEAEEKRQREAQEKARAEAAAKKRKKNIILGSIATVVTVAIVLVMTLVVIPAMRYSRAGKLMEKGQIQKAAIMYYKLGDYQGAREKSFAAWDEVAPRDTFSHSATTIAVKEDGTVVAANKDRDGLGYITSWNNIIAIESTLSHTVGLKADGTVVATGNNRYGQCEVSGWKDIVAIYVSDFNTFGLKADGTVLAIGDNEYGECEVSDWTDIAEICIGYQYVVGLKTDGTVVAAGKNTQGQCNVSSWRNVVDIFVEFSSTFGLKADGTVVAVGTNNLGRCNVSGWTDIVDISVGSDFTVGLKADGTVVATDYLGYKEGYNGECEVSDWTDIVAISAGVDHTVGLKADGTVVATTYLEYLGKPYKGQCDVSDWKDIVKVHAGYHTTYGLKADGTVVIAGEFDDSQLAAVSDWTDVAELLVRGSDQAIALKEDGTILSTKYTGSDEVYQYYLPSWTNIKHPRNCER